MDGRRGSPVMGSAPLGACHMVGVCGRSPARRSCRTAEPLAAHIAPAPPISLALPAGASAHGHCRSMRRRGNHPRLHAAHGPRARLGISRRGSGLFLRSTLEPKRVATPAPVAALLSRQGISRWRIVHRGMRAARLASASLSRPAGLHDLGLLDSSRLLRRSSLAQLQLHRAVGTSRSLP